MSHSILINLQERRLACVERTIEREKPPPAVVKKPALETHGASHLKSWKMEIIQRHEHDMFSLRRKLNALNSALDVYESIGTDKGRATFFYYIDNLCNYVNSAERQLAKAKAAQASFLWIQGVTQAERDQLHWDMSTMNCSIQCAKYDCEHAIGTIDRVMRYAPAGVVVEPPKLAPIDPKKLKVGPKKKNI